MTDLLDVSSAADEPAVDAVDEQLLRQLAERARAEGLRLTGEGGLLARLTKRWSSPPSKASWTIIWATASTTLSVATAGTPATAGDPRRC